MNNAFVMSNGKGPTSQIASANEKPIGQPRPETPENTVNATRIQFITPLRLRKTGRSPKPSARRALNKCAPY
jgi:hypothetical protein